MAASDLKVDRINGAFSKLRISGITVIPSVENNKLAMGTLEALMNEMFDRNICLGYNFEDEPDINTKSGIKPAFYNSVDSVLAFRLMADFGKGFQPDQTLVMQSRAGASHLYSAINRPNPTQYPSRMPTGAVNSTFQRFYSPAEQAPATCLTNAMGYDPDSPNINDFSEHFNAYLKDSESISSFTIEADSGLTILSSSISNEDIIYRIQADGTTAGAGILQVKIVVTTYDDRVITRVIDFKLTEVDL